jgi:hypothetical protein
MPRKEERMVVPAIFEWHSVPAGVELITAVVGDALRRFDRIPKPLNLFRAELVGALAVFERCPHRSGLDSGDDRHRLSAPGRNVR